MIPDRKFLLLFEDQFHQIRINPEIDLTAGDIIDDEIMSVIDESAIFYGAVRKATDIISCGENNRRQIISKLSSRGYPKEISESAADYLVSHGYIDEKKQIGMIIRNLVEKKRYGLMRIKAELYKKGYDGAMVSEFLENALAEYEEIFIENCAVLIERNAGNPPYSPLQYKKIAASMQRYGYTLSQIKSAIKSIDS